jgi:hypothetical protein
MSLRTYARRIGTMGAASLAVHALTATSANAAALFNGCSFGSTPQRAIEKAIDDAENSASGEGLFNCELVGEPLVWWDGLRFRPRWTWPAADAGEVSRRHDSDDHRWCEPGTGCAWADTTRALMLAAGR